MQTIGTSVERSWLVKDGVHGRRRAERRNMSGIDVRKVVLSQIIELAFLQTRKRDWMTPISRSMFGVSLKLFDIVKLLIDASIELRKCEVSNGQIVPSNEFLEKLARCLFEVFAIVGGMRVNQDMWIAKVLRLLDRKQSGEYVIRR